VENILLGFIFLLFYDYNKDFYMTFKEEKQYRLPGYDYSQNGYYFVTIITKDHQIFFGGVVDGIMILSDIGKVANNFWLKIPKHFPHVKLREYIIMPNHVHGILEIDWDLCRDFDDVERSVVGTGHCPVQRVDNDLDIQRTGQCPVPTGSAFGYVTPKSLSTIIGSFKSIVTKTVNIQFPNSLFGWQRRFRDTVIRHEEAFYNLRRYIIYNPSNWQLDRNNPGSPIFEK